ncbi:MAG TPA: hypothetical protein VD788_14280, partial [Candidatus Polarisedimenticolaceae bacterium]|nr:hypothetical protein [Candidatus Polarisedimenticolaceae bacterium]
MIHARLAGVVVAAGLIGVAALAYTPTLEFGYAQDSWPAVKANPVVERGDLREVFTSDYWKGTGSFARTLYRPVAVASFAIERRLSGEADPRLSHLINILLHGLTAWLFYRLSRVLGAAEPVAIAAAVLFVLHPLALHTVANVVGRADTLAVLFSLVALRCLASPRRRLAAWGMAAAVWLALGSKEIGAAVVPLLAVAEAIYRFPRGDARDAWRDRLAVFGPTVAAVLLYLHLRTLAIGEFPGWQPLAIEDNLLVGLSGLQRVATTLAMAGRYALLSVAPVGLSPDYSGGVIQAETSLLAPLPLLGVALSAAGIALVALGIPRGGGAPGPTRRLCRFAAALVVVPYLFVGNVLTLNAAGFAERMVYFSSTGFCLLVAIAAGAAIARLAAGRVRVTRAAWVAVVVVCASLELVQLRRHLPMWEDNRALFDYTARVAPRSLRAALQVAGRHEAEGRPDEALEIYRRIETFAPD